MKQTLKFIEKWVNHVLQYPWAVGTGPIKLEPLSAVTEKSLSVISLLVL